MQTNIERGWGDREVTVNRAKLLETLKANREKHIKEYTEAVAGYKEQATARLIYLKGKIVESVNENFVLIQKKIDTFDPEEPLPDRITLTSVTSFDLQVPRSYERSYDIAIQMAEWEVSETITLKQSQFQCFVLDDWDWQADFKKLSATYGASR